MEPLVIASAFATIVGLLCSFKQERANQNSRSIQDFLKWLEVHRHEQLKEYILANSTIEREIDELLQQDHQQIIAKLEGIDKILAAILSKVDGLGAIGQAIHPDSVLSDQALSILRQLVNSGAHGFMKIPTSQRILLPLVLNGGNITVDDYRFLDDDLRILVKLKFLSSEIRANGNKYGITRKGADYINYLDKQQTKNA